MEDFKKLLLAGFLLGGLSVFTSCATPQNDTSPDITEAVADDSAASTQQNAANPAAGDTSEAELTAEGKPAVQAPPDTMPSDSPPADQTANELDAPPAADQMASNDNSAATPPAPAPAPASPPEAADNTVVAPPPPETETGGAVGQITGLDFKANLNGGTVVIKTDKPVAYSTRKNTHTNQYIVELRNTTISKRFQRPYDTKEFSGPIASINGYQAGDSARIVIQLRDEVNPGVAQKGNIISVAGQGGGENSDTVASAGEVAPPASENGDGAQQEAVSVSSTSKEDAALQTSSVDDFTFGNNNKFYGRPISLELKDADIRDVFAFISEESGLNIVLGDDVSGKVTLKLRKIPWDQALMVLLQTKQLGYVRQGNILRISTLSSIQRESDQSRQALEAKRLLEPLHVQVFPISYANVVDIDVQTKDFLSSRGKSRADKRTNNLVVTDIDENLVKIKALVARLDTQTPQVLIEAKIVEARESYTKVVGVNWNFSGAQVDTGMTNSQGSPVYFTPNAGTGSPPSNFLQAGFSLGQMDVFGNLTASLSLLESEGLAKVLSSPRIVTIDRQEAKIEQSQAVPYLTASTSPTTATGTTTGTTSSTTPVATTSLFPQIAFINVNLILSVKPQITVDGSVIMDIDLTREFLDPVVNLGGGSSAPGKESRHAKTQVLIENGDTIVIGGIYQSDTSDTTIGVPWLSKIPVIGWLFKNNQLQRDKNELVMFLTPRILNREKAFGRASETGHLLPNAPPKPITPVGQGAPNPGNG